MYIRYAHYIFTEKQKKRKNKGRKGLVTALVNTLMASSKAKMSGTVSLPFVIQRSQKNFSFSVDGPFHLQSQAREAGDVEMSLESHGSFSRVLQSRTSIIAVARKNGNQTLSCTSD